MNSTNEKAELQVSAKLFLHRTEEGRDSGGRNSSGRSGEILDAGFCKFCKLLCGRLLNFRMEAVSVGIHRHDSGKVFDA